VNKINTRRVCDRFSCFRVVVSTVVSLCFLSSQSYAQTVGDKTYLWGTTDGGACGVGLGTRWTQEALCNEIWACNAIQNASSNPSWPCSPGEQIPCDSQPLNPQERGDYCVALSPYLETAGGGSSRSHYALTYAVATCPEGTVPYQDVCIGVDASAAGSAKENGCGNGQNLTNNPCNVATGNKYRSEPDFLGGPLSFVRSYNSANLVDLGMGKGWTNSYLKILAPHIISNGEITSFLIVSGTGRGESWINQGGTWSGDADSRLIVTQDSLGFKVEKVNSAFERYTALGRLTSSTNANGHQTSYVYDNSNRLFSVTNHFGHSINFTYVNNRLAAVLDSSGITYRYEYDSNANLIAVVFPDNTPNNDSDNPRKIYHYENTSFPNHLTGITDANGDRYATFAYDSIGKAILSELGTTTNSVGQERVQLDYQGGQ
jgi:YD repeat-containing protein